MITFINLILWNKGGGERTLKERGLNNFLPRKKGGGGLLLERWASLKSLYRLIKVSN